MPANARHRYQEARASIRAPGNSCHTSLLSIANLVVNAGISAGQIFEDIRGSIPSWSRRISDREIWDAVNKAFQDHRGRTFIPRQKPSPILQDGMAVPRNIITHAKNSDEKTLVTVSRVLLGPGVDSHTKKLHKKCLRMANQDDVEMNCSERLSLNQNCANIIRIPK